jgi:hypothetical protein
MDRTGLKKNFQNAIISLTAAERHFSIAVSVVVEE